MISLVNATMHTCVDIDEFMVCVFPELMIMVHVKYMLVFVCDLHVLFGVIEQSFSLFFLGGLGVYLCVTSLTLMNPMLVCN